MRINLNIRGANAKLMSGPMHIYNFNTETTESGE